MQKITIRFALCWSLLLYGIIQVTEANFFTHGKSGVQCGENKCLSQVPCKNQKCVCPYRGFGTFLCPPHATDFCVIFNDPVIHGFDISRVEVPINNKVLMAHVESHACGATGPQPAIHEVGCDTRIFAWGEKRRGKLFIRGLEVKLLAYKGFDVYNHAVRIRAHINADGKYEFIEEGNRNFFGNLPYGPPVKTNIPGLGEVKTVYNQEDNIAVVDISVCGVTAGIRGVDFSGKYDFRSQVPGVYVTVDRSCFPRFLSVEKSVCAPPAGQGLSLIEQKSELEYRLGQTVPLQIFMMIKVLTGDAFQDFPNAAPILETLTETAQECDEKQLVEALPLCLFIIHRPLFLNCWDYSRNGNKALSLLDKCIFSLCDTNAPTCDEVKTQVALSKCGRYAPVKDSILQHSCYFD
ncbi:uncharacterized protein LOC101846445 [Aplysia californica]|uniref:Uncharacterized protein LOC101846445 n=1 Tax=Aplysia californica TaxID=6500 RepID=A0ABM1A6B6_APLCA|nr:uncharacterized protein LOC101846445 [Aplysia californica]